MAADRISNLPDDALVHILTFLPIKLAVQTTILSKRWNQLFRLLPVISLHGATFEDFQSFLRFMNALLMPPLAQNITLKSFSLHYNHGFRHQRRYNDIFNEWLESVVQRHLEELHLYLYRNVLNPDIFISQTLVDLKLECLEIGMDTSNVQLPSLKTLFLEEVWFENQTDCIDFLLGCPNLQDLHAEDILFNVNSDDDDDDDDEEEEEQEEEGTESWTLSKLVRATICSMNFLFKFAKNVEFLHLNMNEKVSFKAMPMFGNVIHIELEFRECSFLPCWNDVVELLRHCPNLQILFISKWTETDDASEEWKLPISEVECVSSHLRSCTVLNFDSERNDLRFAKYVLQNASLLQDMKLGVVSGMSQGMLSQQIIEELSSCLKLSSSCELSFEP